MPTDKPRLNVVLEPPLYLKVKKLAKKDGVSLSLKARDLIRDSLVRDQAADEPNVYSPANSKNLREIKKIIRQHKKILEKKFKVKKIGVFGSYARGEQRQKSDLDILVEFSGTMGGWGFLDLEEYLQEMLKTKVDLTTPGALKKRMKGKVLEEVVFV
jgi:uncharacterized protein